MEQKTKHIILLTIIITLLIGLYFFEEVSYIVRSFGFLLTIVSFYLVDSFFNIKFRKVHYFIIVIIATTGILFSPLYFISTQYDKLLHLILPILSGTLIFYILNKLRIKFHQKIILTIFITISILALFEIGEFILDYLFDWKLQGVYTRDITGLDKKILIMEPNTDTMIDLILGTIGTLIYALLKTLSFCSKNECKRKTKK